METEANNLPDTAELAHDAAPEQAPEPSEQPDTDQPEDDGSDLDTQETDPEFEEVEYEGKKYALPKELKDAILRQSDYTRKTQELAQTREQSQAEIAQEKARIEAERANIQSVARVYAIDERLQQYAGTDWQALSQSDPVAAQQQFFTYQQLKDARAQVIGQIQQHESQRALRESEATARSMQQAQEVLGREIKGWSPALAKELRGIAKDLGASDDAINGIREPWVVRALHAQKVLREMTAKATKPPPAPPAQPVKTVTGGTARAAVDPDKMDTDAWMKWRAKQVARRS
jgi:hypothetical protein